MLSRFEAVTQRLLKQQSGDDRAFAVRTDPAPFVQQLLSVLFPQVRGRRALETQELYDLYSLAVRMLTALNVAPGQGTVEKIIDGLPEIHTKLLVDAQAIFDGDPAARSVDEVIIAYPGFLAIAIFRVAHEFHLAGVPILPRLLTEFAHEKTGIDIHPGADIGPGFCIDHGTGIVIGETTTVGKNVKLYQGVTLGALSVDKGNAGNKRHPTVEDNVVLYSNATVLGGETVIGHDSIIGGNVWITESVPPRSVIYHKAEVTLKNKGT